MYNQTIMGERAKIAHYSNLIAKLEEAGCPFDVRDAEMIEQYHPDCVDAARTLRDYYNQTDNARELRSRLIIEVTDMARELMGGAGIASGWGHADERGKADISTNIVVDEFEGEDETYEFYRLA